MAAVQPAGALRRLVAAAEAGGAAAADLWGGAAALGDRGAAPARSVVGEFLARGGVFPGAVLRQAGLLPRTEGGGAPEGLLGGGGEGGGSTCATARRGAARRGGCALTAYSYDGMHCSASDAFPQPATSCCRGARHQASVSANGLVFCKGENYGGVLGVGDRMPRKGFVRVRLPWLAAAVSCGDSFSVALRRGGTAVCSWGEEGVMLGRSGASKLPAEVQGLPPGDPVALLEAGPRSVIAVTQSGDAYGWGSNMSGELALPLTTRQGGVPLRIAALSGRGLRRLTCGGSGRNGSIRFAVAETGAGELLGWGVLPVQAAVSAARQVPQPPRQLHPRAGRIIFPLRTVAAGCAAAVAVADGAGQLWCLWEGQDNLASVGLPTMERVVRAAVGEAICLGANAFIVALTAGGCLWECRAAAFCRSITAAHPDLLGLLPCKTRAGSVPLIADVCGGIARLRLLARIAVRLRLPCDPVHAILTGFVVHQDFMTGPADAPFSWPPRSGAEA
eukprot:TRINITY_DN3681_c1_g1_i1.p1 TRINITY_DN3681_c1_g1~~TRINITY_DN3681_c1_g1_i1.p1  ORF type:complete len:529 (+),score=55.11 TRINITY_DN3681_c1_g1_i1:77-1588(+)